LLIRRLWLNDFRSYASAELDLAAGLTAVVGANGAGKSNVLEALGYLATLDSFRGAPTDALIRSGATTAVVRAEGVRGGRDVLVEAEITTTGRNRVLVNRQRLQRARDLLGALRVTVFSPDDLAMVKGGPSERRRYLDNALVALHPRNDALRAELERVLRQRNALLKQCAGGTRFDASAATTLDVWDAKLIDAGEALAAARVALIAQLQPVIDAAYASLSAGSPGAVVAAYESTWLADGLAATLPAVRKDELRRGVTLAGPQRDDLGLVLNGRPARTHASQGEQRSLALALRLAAHEVVTRDTGEPPVLLLDDVFSELDPDRSAALVAHLPATQTVLTTAGELPSGAAPDRILRIDRGTVVEDAA
jgi:DNA replication and repair protein RecF